MMEIYVLLKLYILTDIHDMYGHNLLNISLT
jgi:hypothetical protein